MRAVAKLTRLTDLQLSGTRVSDDGMACVANLPNLARLGLRGTRVTAAGMASMAGLQQLESLNLAHTAVGSRGGQPILPLTQLTNPDNMSLSPTFLSLALTCICAACMRASSLCGIECKTLPADQSRSAFQSVIIVTEVYSTTKLLDDYSDPVKCDHACNLLWNCVLCHGASGECIWVKATLCAHRLDIFGGVAETDTAGSCLC